MALTNYLTQTVLGVVVLTALLADVDFINRSAVLLFVLAVWALQLWWSQAWLSRYQFGPAEWLWRVATYRKPLQPLRRKEELASGGSQGRPGLGENANHGIADLCRRVFKVRSWSR